MPPYPCPVNTYHTDTYPAISPTLPHLSTKGKNVVITGGGSGLGPAFGHSLAASGASSISLIGRKEETLLQTKTKLEKEFPNTKIFIFITDLVDHNAVLRTFDAIKSSVGTVDILVANAGFAPELLSIEESKLEDWYTAFDINVKGNFNLIQGFLPTASKTATVLHVSAGVAHIPYLPGFSGYHASKLASAKMFDYLRHEHPDFFVLNFHPGIIKTAMSEKGNPRALAFDAGK